MGLNSFHGLVLLVTSTALGPLYMHEMLILYLLTLSVSRVTGTAVYIDSTVKRVSMQLT